MSQETSDIKLVQSPKRYRSCGYFAEDETSPDIMNQTTDCFDKTGTEVYEFDMLAVYCSWLNGILLTPVLWLIKTASFDLDTDQAYILDQPKPDFIGPEVLPLMTKISFVVGTILSNGGFKLV